MRTRQRLGALFGLAMALLVSCPTPAPAQQTKVTDDLLIYGTLTTAGAVVSAGEISATISSDQNDYAPTGLSTASVLTVTPSGASRTITGLAAPSGGVQQRLLIRNGASVVTGYTLTLPQQSSSSSSGDRFVNQGGVDLVLQPGETAEYMYLGSAYRLVGKNASSAGAPSGSASGDLGATYPAPTVVAVHDGGGTRYTLGTWSDTRVLQVSGTSVTSSALGGDVSGPVGSVVVDKARGLRGTGGTTYAIGSATFTNGDVLGVVAGGIGSITPAGDVTGAPSAFTVSGAHFNGTALAYSNTITDGYLLGRSGSTITGVPVGATSGVALYDDERFEDLFDTGPNRAIANNGSTDISGSGIFNGMTGSGGGSNGSNRYGLYRQNLTGAVSGNSQTQTNHVADAYLAMGPKLTFKHAIQRTTNIRTFVGYSTATCQPVTADDPAGAAIGFQYSTARGDSSIKFMWDNGTTQGTDTTGVSFTADVPLVFVVDWNRVSAKVTGRIYSTNGSAWSQVYSYTQSTGLPADTTNFVVCSGAATLTGSTVYFRTYQWWGKLRGL